MTTINVNIDGSLQFIWDDALQPLLELGKPNLSRASHVEPTHDGQWTLDLSPVGGPVLGPFKLRGEALDEELRWLHDHGF